MLYAAYKDSGNSYDTLSPKKHTGRTPRLGGKQIAQIPRILTKGAAHFGFETDLWTSERVAKIIKDRYRISYS